MAEIDRIRWRCRRGLLELDLVLTRFLDQQFADLTEQEKQIFIQIINYSDNDLWDLITNRAVSPDLKVREIIALLK